MRRSVEPGVVPVWDEQMLMRIAGLALVVVLAGCASAYNDGVAAANRRDWKTAERLYEQAIRNGDNVGMAWNNLGVVYLNTGRQAAGVQAYRMAARYGDAVAQGNLARMGESVPPPDLAPSVSRGSGADLAGLALTLGNAAVTGYNQGRAAGAQAAPPATLQPSKPAPETVRCTSTVTLPVINTTCTK